MRTEAYYKGHSIGWDLAGRYILGTRSERRAIRTRLSRMATADWSRFVEGVLCGFDERAEDRARAILDGNAPRTINPHKLRNLMARV